MPHCAGQPRTPAYGPLSVIFSPQLITSNSKSDESSLPSSGSRVVRPVVRARAAAKDWYVRMVRDAGQPASRKSLRAARASLAPADDGLEMYILGSTKSALPPSGS